MLDISCQSVWALPMRRFLSGLILLIGLAFAPGTRAGEWQVGGEASPQTREALEERRKERVGIYVIASIAAAVVIAVASQLAREFRQTVPRKRSFQDHFDD